MSVCRMIQCRLLAAKAAFPNPMPFNEQTTKGASTMLSWFQRPAGTLDTRGGRSRPDAPKRRLWSDSRGATAVVVAASMLPIMVAVAAGVEVSRLAGAKASLQNAVDAAALAGATLYTAPTQSGAAKLSAQAYFDAYAQRPDITLSNSTVTAAPSASDPNVLTVTVTATANLKTLFGQVLGMSNLTVNVSAVASIPYVVVPPPECGNGCGAPNQPIVPSKSTASDWNSAYIYWLPHPQNGTYSYTTYPPFSQFFEIASNCNGITDANWLASSRCNAGAGAVPPASLPPKPSADQPIGFMFVNMNNGMAPAGQNGYGKNQWGAQPGYYEAMTTSPMTLQQPPTKITNTSATFLQGFQGADSNGNVVTLNNLVQSGTTYPTGNSPAKSNCAIVIQALPPGTPLPANPPAGIPGNCFASNDSISGYQYANLSCRQIAGRSMIYWWNDMGAPTDDYDYKNLYFKYTCYINGTDPSGQGNSPGAATPTIPATLIQ